jgi:hypothetical protein
MLHSHCWRALLRCLFQASDAMPRRPAPRAPSAQKGNRADRRIVTCTATRSSAGSDDETHLVEQPAAAAAQELPRRSATSDRLIKPSTPLKLIIDYEDRRLFCKEYFSNASPFSGIRIALGEFGASCAEIERAEIDTTRAENDHHHSTVSGRRYPFEA